MKSGRELVFLSACELAQAIREGDVSSVEVVEAHLRQIERHNARLNAVVTLDAEGARRRAAEADVALAQGTFWGPLHGVPVTIKDSFEVAGLRTTFGYKPLSRHIPSEDASVVTRLRAAGAVLLGKTNVPEVSFDWQCRSPIFGRTNNPWDLSRTPGGSTGGGAAAVAAGLSPLEIGSDGAGSIRIPAHFCGVFGFKPTGHWVSSAGHMRLPGTSSTTRNIISYGPLARSVPDLRLALSILAGPDSQDWEVPPVPWEEALPAHGSSPLRFAWTDDLGVPVTSETRAALADLAAALKRQGHQVERREPSSFDCMEALETWGEIAGAEMAAQPPAYQRIAVRAIFSRLFGPGPWTRGFVRGMGLNMRRYLKALARRDSLSAALEAFLAEWDAWLCPVAAVPAFTHRRRGTPIVVDGRKVPYSMAAGAYVTIFNMTESPVVVVPVGFSSEGLPIGVQAVGRRWKDAQLLTVAERIAAVTSGGCPRPPDF